MKGTAVMIFGVFAAVLPTFGRILRPQYSGFFVRGCKSIVWGNGGDG